MSYLVDRVKCNFEHIQKLECNVFSRFSLGSTRSMNLMRVLGLFETHLLDKSQPQSTDWRLLWLVRLRSFNFKISALSDLYVFSG
jgi:hypothetical protein